MQAGEGFLLLGVILRPPLGLFLLLTSSLILMGGGQRQALDDLSCGKMAQCCEMQVGGAIGKPAHLKTLLPLPLPLATDPVLLCPLGTTLLLQSTPVWQSRVNPSARQHAGRELLQRPQRNCSHNPLLEADELLLLLLPALKVNLDQSLQFHQVLLHPLPVDVLQTKDRRTSLCAWLICIQVNLGFVTEGSLTSKSTFSPSGIFGGMRLGMLKGLWQGKEQRCVPEMLYPNDTCQTSADSFITVTSNAAN